MVLQSNGCVVTPVDPWRAPGQPAWGRPEMRAPGREMVEIKMISCTVESRAQSRQQRAESREQRAEG
jgi:hypothetical protein